ncbi:uncharacterized protein A1O9_01055 [Exophiala aquamarina CBS 119918]|uniref:CWH43-like N-terminal domain-containing protein n=1 Tax=Exophiala aquamarina CBS 119918 TaxID=1182545 RepID=A0A072PSI9_9EURO|nr:uncharacterized protein A1O9_01055 [Exophiala aquamarina CBS 119918]KEF63079.1 hypothetical protein A1O9_01055 [Exophiala aquamarina CBS 119918]
MLLAMFIRWEVIGHPIYPSMESGQTIAYISDVGAYGLKPLFITGSVITTVSLDLGFMAERWLRHTGRLVPNTSTAQKVLSMLAIISAVGGSAGLILLSIFDTYRHPHLHDGFLLLFLGGYILSAIFICASYQRLGIHYREHRVLRISFWVKLAFILIELALAGVFIGTSFTHHRNIAAVFEWIVALVFTGYILSFLLDLLPSVRSRSHQPQGWRHQTDVEKANLTNGSNASTPVTTDSQGPNADGRDLIGHGAYRGTAMTNGPNAPADQQDLGRQKKWGVGKFRF